MALRTLRTSATAIPEDNVLQFVTDILTTSGVFNVSAGQLLVTPNAALSVAVAAGRAYLLAAAGNGYPVINTASATVSVSSNGNANPRITSIVLYIDLSASANSDASNVAKLTTVDGTPGSSPSAPSNSTIQSAVGSSNPFIVLANVTVPSGATNLSSQGVTTDVRTPAAFSVPGVVGQDGWTPITDTFTYVSANSFKILSTDRTAVYRRGTRIKCTNNAITFYGVLDRDSSLSGSDTLITCCANNDFSLTNSAITSPFYSYTQGPQGFPGRFAYTPTYSASSGTYNATDVAYFTIDGRKCTVSIFSNGTTSGATNEITATLPVNAVGNQGFGATINDGGGLISGNVYVLDTLNVLHVNRYDNAAFGAGSSRTIKANIVYFI